MLRIWKLRCQRNADQHYDAADRARKYQWRFTYVNIIGSIVPLGAAGSIQVFMSNKASVSSLIGLGAAVFVITSILQTIRDDGARAAEHKNAGAAFARKSREIEEYLCTPWRVTPAIVTTIRAAIDLASASSPNVPLKVFSNPRYNGLKQSIEDLEARLLGFGNRDPENPS
jgi:hypothetical protein